MENIDVFRLATKMALKSKDFLVYTCITGAYEKKNYDHVLDPDIRYVCFTDDEAYVPKGWEFRPIKGLEHLNYKDQNRYIKMHPHLFFPNLKISIYLDYNIQIIKKLRKLFLKIKGLEGTIFMYEHPFRDCSYKEIKKVVSLGLITFNNGKKQYKKYKDMNFPQNLGLFEANIIIRKHKKEAATLMEYWWKEYNNSSKRDQTSLVFSSYQTGIKIKSLGQCNLREGGDYFHLNLSKQSRTFKHKFKSIICRLFNAFLIKFKSF